MDLAGWYAGGRWVGLLELIDMLPTACRLNEAMANDMELAEILAGLPEPTEKWAPRVSENTLMNMLLAKISNGIDQMIQTQIGTAGGKPAPVKPFPTPRTALQIVRAKQERQWAEEEVQRWGFDASDI